MYVFCAARVTKRSVLLILEIKAPGGTNSEGFGTAMKAV
jgi:hypothetical protein